VRSSIAGAIAEYLADVTDGRLRQSVLYRCIGAVLQQRSTGLLRQRRGRRGFLLWYRHVGPRLQVLAGAGAATIRFRPAVYLNLGDSQKSWLNLNAACAGGAVCEGVSVARYLKGKFENPPTFDSLVWNDERLAPQPNPIPPGHANAKIPVLVWQYHGDYLSVKLPDGSTRSGDIDFEMVNPAYDGFVTSGLVPPPPRAELSIAMRRSAFAGIREELAFGTAAESELAAILSADASTAQADRTKLTKLAAQRGLNAAMTELLDFAFTATPKAAQALRYWVVVDFSRPSSEPRFHIFDRAKNAVESLLVAHGVGSACRDDSARACSFGNVPGSYKSSLGIFRCGDKYLEGDHWRMMVHGLQQGVNNKAFSRLIRIHESWYVSDQHVKKFGRCGCSEGCFVLDEKVIDRVVEELTEGSFMIAVKDHA
jgi:L,D-transpeptidase catalytic domain